MKYEYFLFFIVSFMKWNGIFKIDNWNLYKFKFNYIKNREKYNKCV